MGSLYFPMFPSGGGLELSRRRQWRHGDVHDHVWQHRQRVLHRHQRGVNYGHWSVEMASFLGYNVGPTTGKDMKSIIHILIFLCKKYFIQGNFLNISMLST